MTFCLFGNVHDISHNRSVNTDISLFSYVSPQKDENRSRSQEDVERNLAVLILQPLLTIKDSGQNGNSASPALEPNGTVCGGTSQ